MVRRIALICLLVALSGCGGGNDKSDAEQTVRDFVQATRERDADKFCDDLVTEESCKREFKNLSGLRVELVRIEKTKLDGDHATVTAVLERQGQRLTQELRLKKEDGDWKLAGADE